MSYIGKPLSRDVFFSYAHGGDTRLREWSLHIPDRLRQEIQTSLRIPSGVEIFQDPDLDRAGKFAQQLQHGASSAGVLLIVLTSYYVESDWCEKERSWFREALQRSGRQDDAVFVARALPVDPRDWPAELQGRLGYLFHDEKLATTKPDSIRPFGWFDQRDPQFQACIVDLAGDISQRLRELKRRNDAVQEARPGYGPLDKKALYLHARPQDAKEWTTVRETLRAAGFVVFPQAAPAAAQNPVAIENARRENVDLCAECDALLLLRPSLGSWIDLEVIRIGMRFRKEVDERRNHPIPCAMIDLVGEHNDAAEDYGVERLEVNGTPPDRVVDAWLAELRAGRKAQGR